MMIANDQEFNVTIDRIARFQQYRGICVPR